MKGNVAAYEIEQSSRAARSAPTRSAPKPESLGCSAVSATTATPSCPKRLPRSAKPATRCSTARPCGASPKTGMPKGLKTSKGYLWEGSKVRQMLLRPSIAGLAVHNGEILDGVTPAWKPIVDRDTWESVRKYLSDPKRFTGRSMGRKHLLSRHRLLRRMRQAHGHHGQADQERHETPCLPMQEHGLHEDRARPDPHRRTGDRHHHRAAGRPRGGAQAEPSPPSTPRRCTTRSTRCAS